MPTIPLRLNYLHWMEDLLLKDHGLNDEISGIDIGCGASCVYCLLAVRMHPEWKMYALEIDDENIKFAGENIKQNQLNDRVDLITQEHNKVIFTTLFKKFPGDKTFCICNPPFFKSHEEFIGENRSGKRKASKSAGSHSGSPVELIYEDGGELGFVTRILCESLELKEKVKIYSTMIGCKKNLHKFMNELRTRKVDNFITTEFVQGKTMRWGIAWSFNVNLKKCKIESNVQSQSEKVAGKVLSYQIVTEDFSQTFVAIKTILNELEIQLKILNEKSECIQCRLHVTKNTWSNQRSKRRAEMKNLKIAEKPSEVVKENLEIGMEFKRIENSKAAELKMFFIDGNMNKDSVNQILQYIKNKVR